MATAARLGETDILALFDRAEGQPPQARAAAVLAAVLPETDPPARRAMTLGDRDRLLWDFKSRQFGSTARARFRCEACEEDIGLPIGDDFTIPPATRATAQLRHAGRDWTLRLPVVADLDEAAATGRFPVENLCPDAPWDDPGFAEAAAQALDAADPGMDITFEVACGECGHVNRRGFDVMDFLWQDIETSALRSLVDVVTLARAFGWSEAQCLAVSPERRARYIGMIS